jgi:hypothetical protein
LQKVATTFFCALVFLMGLPNLFAEEALPEIEAYSQLNFAVHRGDVIKLQVEAAGENIDVKWVKSDEILCRQLSCEIDTASWGLGSHNIAFVLFNSKGSLFLKYKVKILTVPPGYQPGPVTPEIVREKERIETVQNEGFAVVTTVGRGFSSHNRKVQVVGPLARSMEWTEKLRTQPGARMELFSKGREVHYLLPSSNIALAESDKGRRAVVLRKGTVRSRQLEAKLPEWGVLGGNWLQVDGDEKADFFVRMVEDKTDEYIIGVFRGNAKIVSKNVKKKEKGTVKYEMTLAAGEMVLIKRGMKTSPKKEVGTPALFGEVFRESTPNYLFSTLLKEKTISGHTVLGDKLPAAEKNSVSIGQESLSKLDFVVAVEVSNKDIQARNSSVGLVTIAEAYLGLLQISDTLQAIEKIKEIDNQDPSAYFLEAVAHILDLNWVACLTALDEAESRDFHNQQLLEFYRGRCSIGVNSPVAARNSLTYAMWEDQNPAVTAMAQNMLTSVNADRWLQIEGKMGAGFDNNVFRLSPSSTLMAAAGARESWFVHTMGGARVWPFKVEAGHFEFGVTFDRKDYTNRSLKDYAQLMQKLDLGLQLNFGSGDVQWIVFNIAAWGQLDAVGTKRTQDTLGSSFSTTFPSLWALKLHFRNVVNSDPFPQWDDKIDSKRQEIVAPTDRSSKDKSYGLGVVPVNGNYRLAINVENLSSNYKSSETVVENYVETQFYVENSLWLTRRNQLSLDLKSLNRTFTDATFDRKDTFTDLNFGWQLLWTTSVRHLVELKRQQVKSSDSDYSFSRQVLSFDLIIDF